MKIWMEMPKREEIRSMLGQNEKHYKTTVMFSERIKFQSKAYYIFFQTDAQLHENTIVFLFIMFLH